ncbi:MAG: alpha/beta fold hydrolase [Planctomycetales bacterium]
MTQSQIQSQFLDVAGKKTQLTVGGSGPPLLYLHSAGGETEWLPFHERLAENYQVFLPAHPGFSLSEGLDAIDDIHDLVWHYVDLLDELELESVPIVGFSLGAWIAAELAILRPARVQRMVLTAAAGIHVDGAPMGEIFIDDLQKIRDLVFYDPTSEAAKVAVPLSLDDDRILNWIRAREASARVGWNPYLHNPKLAGHLHRVSCPTLVVWGRQDKVIPVAHGEYYASHIPAAQLTVFDQCGHMVPYEKPAEFDKLVKDFLAR